MNEIFKYSDTTDKAYGVTGMAISIVALDAEDLLESLSIDGDADSTVVFQPEYYFSGNPRYSARIAWNNLLRHYQLSMAMVIGNVLCREYVLHSRSLKADVRDALLQLVSEEGSEACSLEADEINQMFSKNLNYLHRLFAHQGVQSIARDFADTLSRARVMSRADVIEHLRSLSFL